jgi:hypothetical protein
VAITKISYQFTIDTPEDKQLEAFFFKRLHTAVMEALIEELPSADIIVRWDKIDE